MLLCKKNYGHQNSPYIAKYLKGFSEGNFGKSPAKYLESDLLPEHKAQRVS